MKSILVGAVDTTRIAMEILAASGVPPAALFTLPLSKSSRHSDFIHLAPKAEELGIPIVPIANVNRPEVLAQIRAIAPDYSFVIGWSQICRADFLGIAKIGSIGYHPAPLPENRGRAVIPWTILQNRKTTGSTLFWMDEGADSGDILNQEIFPLDPDETATTLYRKHCESFARMFAHSVQDLKAFKGQKQPQHHSLATYCAKRIAEDGLIDWNQPAADVWRLIRAVTKPYPGAFTFYNRQKLIIWEAELVGTAPYWGLPGQIQKLDRAGALVQCGDKQHILLKKIQLGAEIVAPSVLKQHAKLGISWLEIFQSQPSQSPKNREQTYAPKLPTLQNAPVEMPAIAPVHPPS